MTAPTTVLVAPALAADGPPTSVAVPDQSPDRGSEKSAPSVKKTTPDEGVTISVHGVPDTFTAGGPWQELTLVVNAEPTDSDREVTLIVEDNETLRLNPDHTDVQVRGTSGWQAVDADRWSQANPTAHYDLVVPAGATQLSLRMRFHRDAPLVHFYLAASDGISLDSPEYESQLVLPADPGAPGGGEPTDPADPGTGDPTDPADPGTGDPTGPPGPAGPGTPTDPAGPGNGEPTRPGTEAGAGAGDPAGPAGSGAGESGPSDPPAAPGPASATGEEATPDHPADAPSGTLAETGATPGARWLIGTGGTAITLGAAALHRFRRRPAS
ncbi:hypothetical protein [Streptomyces sp. NPDC047141]|uniref:hypothetical protein n=1 Tax=Streptomyces sp. NPDC047141 TaxID=3155738 RepID=UPI0033E21181